MTENEDCRNKMPVLRRCGRVRRRRKNGDRTEKNAEDRPKKNVSRVIIFSNGFVFARMPGHGRARMRTSPIFRESAANGRTRERIGQMRRSNRQKGVGRVTNASLFADGTLSFREICFSASSGCRLAFCAKNADGSRVRRSRRHGKNCRSRRARRLRKA